MVIIQLVGSVRAEEGQLEMLVGPDQVGVEDLLVGQQRHRHDRDQQRSRARTRSQSLPAELVARRGLAPFLRPVVGRQPRPAAR